MQLPKDFALQMSTLLGADEYQKFCNALDAPPCVSVRANPFKDASGEGLRSLDCGEAVAWSSCGRYLTGRPNFTLNPLFHSGTFYVQEASSMSIEQALKQCGSPHAVLDLCAAPGGKSTLMRSLLSDGALLVCNDPTRSRAQVLAENIAKWGHEGCLVTSNYPKDFAKVGPVFDLIAVDAPCSGEGMFRKDNPALEMWSPTNVTICAERQRDIVRTVWPALKGGGYMIYSTCTYNTAENEENIDFFCKELDAEAVAITFPPSCDITGNLLATSNAPVHRFMPHKTKGEGLFLALLRKRGGTDTQRLKGKLRFKPLPDIWTETLDSKHFALLEKDNCGYAIRQSDTELVNHLLNTLYPLHIGLPLYEKKGGKAIPAHELAMSRLPGISASFPTVELALPQALDYLRRQAISIDAKKGYILLTYKNVPLGFANNLGGRANNMYPNNWRIRH